MRYIDVTGKTEAEAIAKALEQLGLDRDDVSVEILERAKSGFLGIGASPAKVRVTYDDAPEETPVPVSKVTSPPAERPQRTERPQRQERQERQERPERPQRQDRQPRPDHTQRPERAEQPARPEKIEQPEPAAAPRPAPVDLGEEATDAKAEQIRTFLTGLMEHMGSAARVKVYQTEKDRYKVYLEGEKLGQLIGRRGETLDAIQQLTNYSVNRGSDKRVRVHVDAENYREKREQSLQNLALKVAGKVVRYRKNVTLEPMNAYERHVIHTALQEYAHVTTYSTGTDPNRRVVVAYER